MKSLSANFKSEKKRNFSWMDQMMALMRWILKMVNRSVKKFFEEVRKSEHTCTQKNSTQMHANVPRSKSTTREKSRLHSRWQRCTLISEVKLSSSITWWKPENQILRLRIFSVKFKDIQIFRNDILSIIKKAFSSKFSENLGQHPSTTKKVTTSIFTRRALDWYIIAFLVSETALET